jgi:serine/threonine protein kinase
MRVDTLVSERLTASPRIFDTYGLCGIASLSEFAEQGSIEKQVYIAGHSSSSSNQQDSKEEGRPITNTTNNNGLSTMQQLEYALQMTNAIADLHGHVDGVIFHEDIKIEQFLWNDDQTMIKLNDFNRAVFMLWNDQTQEYCPYDENEIRRVCRLVPIAVDTLHPNHYHRHLLPIRSSRFPPSQYRSPEEFHHSHNMTEKVDVFNLASIFYSLLTGRFKTDEGQKNEAVEKGEKIYIDPRYYQHNEKSASQAKFIEIIDKCQEYHPKDRPSIFEVAEELRQAIKLAKKEEEEKAKKSRWL